MEIEDELHGFQIKMAEENVKFYESLVKSSGWRWWDKLLFAWFPTFAVVEFGLMIWMITGHNWFSAILSFFVGCLQIGFMFLNRRTRRIRLESVAKRTEQLKDARTALEKLDPTNKLVPLVIEEEP